MLSQEETKTGVFWEARFPIFQQDVLQWNILSKWMIRGYPYCRKPPCPYRVLNMILLFRICIANFGAQHQLDLSQLSKKLPWIPPSKASINLPHSVNLSIKSANMSSSSPVKTILFSHDRIQPLPMASWPVPKAVWVPRTLEEGLQSELG